MTKILVLIYISILTSGSVLGQGAKSDGKTKSPGKLDSISSPEEVEALIGAIDKRYIKFRVNTALNFEEDYCKSLGDISKFKALSKADFDGNGYADLLLIGILEKSPMILTLMGSSDNRVSIHILTHWRSRRCSIAKTVTEGDHTFIEHRYFRAFSLIADSLKLVFKFGDFVEYNPSPRVYNIEKIEYRFNDAFTLEINSDREAALKATEYDRLRGQYMNAKYIGRINNSRSWSCGHFRPEQGT